MSETTDCTRASLRWHTLYMYMYMNSLSASLQSNYVLYVHVCTCTCSSRRVTLQSDSLYVLYSNYPPTIINTTVGEKEIETVPYYTQNKYNFIHTLVGVNYYARCTYM